MVTQNYPEPNINQTSGLFELFGYLNGDDLTGGYLTASILLVVWIVIFMSTKAYGSIKGIATASFIVSGISILLTVAGLLATRFMYIAFLMSAISIFLLILENKSTL